MPRTVRLAAAWRSEPVALTGAPPGASRALAAVIVSRASWNAFRGASCAPRAPPTAQPRPGLRRSPTCRSIGPFWNLCSSLRIPPSRPRPHREAGHDLFRGVSYPFARPVMPAGQAASGPGEVLLELACGAEVADGEAWVGGADAAHAHRCHMHGWKSAVVTTTADFQPCSSGAAPEEGGGPDAAASAGGATPPGGMPKVRRCRWSRTCPRLAW
jgi:hypothetical protein